MASLVNSAKYGPWLRRGIALLLLGVLCALALHWLAQFTAARIARNEQQWFSARMNALLPPGSFDNDLLADTTWVRAPELLGANRVVVYRARLHRQPSAVIIRPIAPDGYGGPIELLVAIDYSGKVLGVQVLSHHETPGMGNDFELPGATWLDAFRGHGLHQPETPGWNVRKEGGEFEQFTSATISPRAIIKAVQRTLDYYQSHRDALFAE